MKLNIPSILFLISISGPLLAQNTHPVSPMRSFFGLMAGQGLPGYQDGIFTQAKFDHPQGMAFNGDGSKLFVADPGNHRIRVVDTKDHDQVSTLAGTGIKGTTDGPVSACTFSAPKFVFWMASDRLLVFDSETRSFRQIDLDLLVVKTLAVEGAGPLAGYDLSDIRDMVFDPASSTLYFSLPSQQKLASLRISGDELVVSSASTLPAVKKPGCLCWMGDRLFICDQDNSKVYGCHWEGPSKLSTDLYAQGDNIQSLVAEEDRIYALQKSEYPFVLLKPYRIVETPMVWRDPPYFDILTSHPARPSDWFSLEAPSFLISQGPSNPGHFVYTSPERNELISLSDIGQREDKPQETLPRGFTAYGHTPFKGPGIKRFLVVGEPTLLSPAPDLSNTGKSPVRPTTTPYLSLASRLELVMNTHNALSGQDSGYEILTLDSKLADASVLGKLAVNYGFDGVLFLISTSTDEKTACPWLEKALQGLPVGMDRSRLKAYFIPGTGPIADPGTEKDLADWSKFFSAQNLGLYNLTGPWSVLRTAYFPLSDPTQGPNLSSNGTEVLAYLLGHTLVQDRTAQDFPSSGVYEPQVSPLGGFQSLTAGEGCSGFRDGLFATALFDHPGGMTIDDTGSMIYVADTGNHRVRTIDLNNKNRVSTLAGGDQPGDTDGPFSGCAFQAPRLAAWVPGGLVVYDNDSVLRYLDLKTKNASTLQLKEDGKPLKPGRLKGAFNLCYSPQDHLLYLTQPDQGLLEKVSLTEQTLQVILNQDPAVPNPAALCRDQQYLYVADVRSPAIYRFKPTPSGRPELLASGSCPDVKALSLSQGVLYCIHGGHLDWMRMDRPSSNLNVSTWSTHKRPLAFNLGLFQGSPLPNGAAVALIAEPQDDKGFFLLSGSQGQIFNMSDYSFSAFWGCDDMTPDGLCDFDYPRAKPRQTYRILLLGDSHVYRNNTDMTHMENISKRLELFLNTEASLDNKATRYQVLNAAYRNSQGLPPYYWPAFLAPDLAKKYDIDQVLLYLTAETNDNNLAPLYQRRIGSDGIPLWKTDPEDLLRPLNERLVGGRLGDFLKRHLVAENGSIRFKDDYSKLFSDPKDFEDLVYFFGKPLALLKKELSGTRLTNGTSPTLNIVFSPEGSYGAMTLIDPYRDFWEKTAASTGIGFKDLSDPFLALRLTFFPVGETIDGYHPTAEGFSFKSFLLGDELIRDGAIPFQ